MDSNYRKLGIVVAINTVLMFLITYALIDSFSHFHPNVNRVYMALMMTAPMVLVMLFVMRSMYKDSRLNAILAVGFLALFIGSLALARTQTGIGDSQFLNSMIPHHSSAILMCEESSITDQEIADLCVDIIEAQEKEIAQMKAILDERY